MSNVVSKAVKASLFFGIGFFIFYLVYNRQNKAYQEECLFKNIPMGECSLIGKVISDMQSADYRWISLVLFLFLMSNVFRTIRWRMMFEGLGYKPRYVNLFGTIMINYLTNLGIPRSGEIIRAGLITSYEDIPLEKVLGTIFTDRIFDVFCLAIVLVLTLIFGGSDFYNYLNVNIDLGQKLMIFTEHPVLWSLMALAGAGFFIWLFSYRKRLLQTSLGQRVWYRVKGFLDGANSVKTVSSVPLFLLYTVAIWVMYFLMMYISFFSFEPTAHLGPVEGLVVFAFGSLGILFPSPGGMGSYHMLVGEGLSMYGITGADGFSFANIVFFSVSVGINVVLGLFFLIILPIINGKNKIQPTHG
jgi:glycosyltransferase 2 family protein